MKNKPKKRKLCTKGNFDESILKKTTLVQGNCGELQVFLTQVIIPLFFC